MKRTFSFLNNLYTQLGVALTMACMSGASHADGNYDFNDVMSNQAVTAQEASNNIISLTEIAFTVIKAVAFVMGIILVFMGLWRFKKAQDNSREYSMGSSLILMAIGGAMASIVYIYGFSARLITG